MTFELPAEDSEFGQRVRRRLTEEPIGWLTTVDAAGNPQPSPVWFFWEAEAGTALIYSPAGARRVVNLPDLSRAALNLNAPNGHDVIVLTGSLALAPDAPAPLDNAPYLTKYDELIKQVFGTAEKFASMFDTALVFTPKRLRGQ